MQISSDDGSSSSGKTPDQPWVEFQKKIWPRNKIWHGKRLSSKMDGLEVNCDVDGIILSNFRFFSFFRKFPFL